MKLLFQEEVIPRQIKAQLHFQTARSVQWQDRFRSVEPFRIFRNKSQRVNTGRLSTQSGIQEVPVQQYFQLIPPTHACPLLVLLKLTLFPDRIQYLSQLKFQNAK